MAWDNNKQSGWGNKSGGGGGGWGGGNRPPPKELRKSPYLPVVIYVEKAAPDSVKDRAVQIAERLLAKGVVVRISGEDQELTNRFTSLSLPENIEVYIPWKGFENIDSKFYWNPDELKQIAKSLFNAWDKVPDAIHAFLTRNVRMVLGDKNNSVVREIIIFTEDGAEELTDITRETGRPDFFIRTGSRFGIKVTNLRNPTSVEKLMERLPNEEPPTGTAGW